MTTIRVARRDRFVVIDQATLRDPHLSLRAIGLLARLLSYPDDWRINSTEIARQVPEGRDAVRAALRELEDRGYLSRTKHHVARGRWITELVLRESPGRTDDGFPGVGQPGVGQPGVGQPGVGEPGAIEKTVTKDCRDENSRTGLRAACGECDGTGFIVRELDDPHRSTEAARCSCNPIKPGKIPNRFTG